MPTSLIVHGGAWDIPEEAIPGCREGCRRALEAGWKILSRGGTAIEAAESAIVLLEDDPNFDAGTGSHLNLEGRVQLDAILMDGATLKAGAVAAVDRVQNPIRLARKVLEASEHMMLVGAGAEKFAVEHGLPLCAPEELVLERERVAWRHCLEDSHAAGNHFGHSCGTVGAVAMDVRGRIAAGTSTGGTCCKWPGRVGDSPLIGCGCYADDEAGGVSCTGHGEAIMKIVMAKTAIDLLRKQSVQVHRGEFAAPYPSEVAEACVKLLTSRAHSTGGLILLDHDGQPGFGFNTPRMACGTVAPDGSFVLLP